MAVYARFSSDRQSETSIEDQVARCRRFVEERGGTVADELVFADFAVSGASLQRPGWEALMRAVDSRRVDAIIAEDVSRVSRDIADAAAVFKRLQYLGVPLIAVGDAIDTSARGAKLLFGVKTLFSDLYLDDLRDKTMRALVERARAGLATGGLPYGYRSKPRADRKREIVIDEAEARVVRRIFEEYAAGRSRAEIAGRLNDAGIDPPRSTRRQGRPEWRESTVRVVLRNERYIGVWTFGATRWMKVPGTNTRRPQARDASDVIRVERPDLRLIPQELWDAVHVRSEIAGAPARVAAAKRQGSGRRRYLLSGLLHCAACGSVMIVHGGGRYYRCNAAHTKRTCAVRNSIREDVVRRNVVGTLRARFLSPVAAGELRAIIAEELGALRRTASAEREERAARLRRTEARIAGLLSFIADGDRSEYTVQALRDLEAQARTEGAAIKELDARARQPVRLPSPAEVLEVFGQMDRMLEEDPRWGRELLGRLLEPSGITLTRHEDGRWSGRMGVYPTALLDATAPAAGDSQGRRDLDSWVCGGSLYQLPSTAEPVWLAFEAA